MPSCGACAQFRDTQSSGAAQEHEAKKDKSNVRPHLEKDQATVGMGNEHVAPGAGGMHMEVRACTSGHPRMKLLHRRTSRTFIAKQP